MQSSFSFKSKSIHLAGFVFLDLFLFVRQQFFFIIQFQVIITHFVPLHLSLLQFRVLNLGLSSRFLLNYVVDPACIKLFHFLVCGYKKFMSVLFGAGYVM
jgi:hypothetical protein